MKKTLYFFLLLAILAISDNQAFGQCVWTKDARNPVLTGAGLILAQDEKQPQHKGGAMGFGAVKMGAQSDIKSIPAAEPYQRTRPVVLDAGVRRLVPHDYASIQAAIDACSDGDTVLVAEGTYYENISFKGKAITVASEFLMDADTSHISKTIINGSQPANPDSGSVVYFINGETRNSVLYGLSITGGLGTKSTWGGSSNQYYWGGGIKMSAGGRIEFNKIVNNVINRETGIYCYGGGIWAEGLSITDTIIISNNKIVGNVINAWWGGGAAATLLTKGSIVFENNLVKSNIFNLDEGAGASCLYIFGGDSFSDNIIINNNLIERNITYITQTNLGVCSGIYIENCSPKIYNNIIVKNSTTSDGGGIEIAWWSNYSGGVSNPILFNNTVINNNASYGGGILVHSDESGKANPLVYNTIVWGNAATNNPGIHLSGQGSIRIFNSIVQQQSYQNLNSSVFCTDPLFADTLGHLSAQSPAVGRGLASLELNGATYYAPTTDFEGNPRPSPADPGVDIGAYESEYESQPYPTSYSLSKLFFNHSDDFQHFTSDVVNQNEQNIQVYSKFYNADSSVSDSVEMLDDGEHGDSAADDGLYGGSFTTILEETFSSYLVIQNNSSATRSEYNDNKKFTTVGPLVLDSWDITSTDTVPNPGDMIKLKLNLTNLSSTATAKDISIRFRIADTLASVSATPVEFGDIGPGSTATGKAQRYIALSQNFFEYPQDTLPIVLEIASNDYVFWYGSIQMVVGINGTSTTVPMVYDLKQNYPNPFNPSTTIKFQIPNSNLVTLEIYNLLGQKVATLVNEKLTAGRHTVEWNAAGFASGVYLYRLQAGNYTETKKLILLR